MKYRNKSKISRRLFCLSVCPCVCVSVWVVSFRVGACSSLLYCCCSTVTEPQLTLYEEKSRAQAKRDHHQRRDHLSLGTILPPLYRETWCQSRQSERNERIKTKSWWTLSIHVKTRLSKLQATTQVTANLCHNQPCPFRRQGSSSLFCPTTNNSNNFGSTYVMSKRFWDLKREYDDGWMIDDSQTLLLVGVIINLNRPLPWKNK